MESGVQLKKNWPKWFLLWKLVGSLCWLFNQIVSSTCKNSSGKNIKYTNPTCLKIISAGTGEESSII